MSDIDLSSMNSAWGDASNAIPYGSSRYAFTKKG